MLLDFNYTYSHSIDNSSVIAKNNGNFISGTTQVLCNAYDLNVCKSNSEFDATHQITSDFVYDWPIGRKQFITAMLLAGSTKSLTAGRFPE
jgi:hypothetical protein